MRKTANNQPQESTSYQLSSWLKTVLFTPVSVAPLVTFRVLFGLLMAYGSLRFVLSGWVEKLYGEPDFFFKFHGFGWVPDLGITGAYLLYGVIALSALAIAAGWFYRAATVVFFLAFSWSELIDATNYLNHYYLICLLGLLLIFIPAHRAYSLDARRRSALQSFVVPAWCRLALLVQLACVYIFAGLAKLNYDWLFNAMPLAIWLPEHRGLPLIGPILALPETAYLFSWAGAFYDLTIVGWLCWRPSRPWAYAAVVGFHLLTLLLFNIGLFPLIMITASLLFFPPRMHKKWWRFSANQLDRSIEVKQPVRPLVAPLLALFFAIQFLLPLRTLAYPGSTFWTEEGYRFGWRVMLVEKSGQAVFTVHDPATGNTAEVDNREFLTAFQEKQMAIQPDFILQYAAYLGGVYAERYTLDSPRVTADVFVALNGRPSQRLVDPSVDLAAITDGFSPKKWILPLR